MEHKLKMNRDSSRRIDNFRIRDARSDELDDISQLLKEAYLQYENAIPPPAWEAYLQDIMDVRSRLEDAELIVADLGGRPAGAITLYLDASRSSQVGWPRGWAGIRLLAVHPSYRNRGIGRSLMQECLLRCRRQAIPTIGLHTSEIMDVARRMYESMGFTRVPEYDFHPAPGVTVMAYRLDL